MRIAKKQNRALGFKTSVRIVNAALAGGETNFVKILSAVNACGRTVAFNLEHIKAL